MRRLENPRGWVYTGCRNQRWGKLIGHIVSIDADSVQIQTRFSKTEIPIRAIKKIRRIPESSMRDEEYWDPDLNNRKDCVFSGTCTTATAGVREPSLREPALSAKAEAFVVYASDDSSSRSSAVPMR